MALLINESCITCDACLQNCPVNAIVDDLHHPLGLSRYYIAPEKCVECVDLYEVPQCAAICPSEGCITWDLPFTPQYDEHFSDPTRYVLSKTREGALRTPKYRAKKYITHIPLTSRGVGIAVQDNPPITL